MNPDHNQLPRPTSRTEPSAPARPFVPTAPINYHAAPTARVAGVDVAQLLGAIGEASANDSSTALFGLLLGAQAVLAQVQAGTGPSTPGEAALLAAYRAMSDHARSEVIAAARAGAEQFPRQRPALTLVQHGQRQHGGAR